MVSQNSSAVLQRQMRNVREDLSEHADVTVKKARQDTDWRYFVANHPWTSLGAAVALGYLLVPRRACCKTGNSEAVSEAADRVARAVQPSLFAGVIAGGAQHGRDHAGPRGFGLGDFFNEAATGPARRVGGLSSLSRKLYKVRGREP